jgi:dienelactone hydrolase
MRSFLAIAVCLLVASEAVACEGGALATETMRITRPVADEHDKGEIQLETYIYRPKVPGRLPTVIYNHGSTGAGQLSVKTKAFPPCELVQFFTQSGYAVVAPNRRGRGDSSGTYVEECFGCNPRQYYAVGVRGLEEALKDIDATVVHIVGQAFVDKQHVVLAGQSRGGFLSVLYAGRHPERFKGVINFSGGWFRIAANQPPESVTFMHDQFRLAGQRNKGPMLWLYREGDARFPPAAIQGFYESFRKPGGNAELHVYSNNTGGDGHFFVNQPSLWSADLQTYLAKIR